ncbi:MAG: PEP-CTERM system TPR-repeat protein PrsT [Burkholderiales bacterium]|nr:PEP-CTERM system TPR-repeat protein PrsT [Burkholderiales bacterium]
MRLSAYLFASLFCIAATGCNPASNSGSLEKAKEFLAKGEHAAAILEVKNVIANRADSPEARYLLGKALLESGNPAGAEIELRRAKDEKFPVDQVLPLLLRSLLAKGEARKVIHEAAGVLLTSPSAKVEAKAYLSLAYLAIGDKGSAAKEIAEGLATQSDHPLAMLVEARIKLAAGDVKAALSLLDALIAKHPRDYDGQYLRASVLFALQQYDQSEQGYRKALELRKDDPSARGALVFVRLQRAGFSPESPHFAAAEAELAEMKRALPNQVRTIFLEAQVAYYKGDLQQASERIQLVLRSFPNDFSVLQLAGALRYRLGAFVEAENHLRRALQIDSKSVPVRRWLALTYIGLGQMSRAIETITPALRDIENDPDMLHVAGEVFMQAGDFKRAEGFFRKAVELKPDDSSKRLQLAFARLAAGQFEAGTRDLERMAETDSGITADLALVAAHFEKRSYEKALSSLTQLEKKRPRDAMVQNLRGRILLAAGKTADARRSFENAVALSPSFLPAAMSLAELDIAQDKGADALARLEKVLAAEPRHVPAMLALAGLKAAQKSPAAEIEALIQKAVEASPADPAPRLALVRHLIDAGDKRRALSAAQNAYAAMPSSADIASLLGQAQIVAGEFNQALVTFGKMAAAESTAMGGHMGMADAHEAAGNNSGAIESLQKALRANPGFVPAQLRIVAIYVRTGRAPDALAFARNLQREQPRSSQGFVLEGEVRLVTKELAEAEAAFRSAMKIADTSETAIKLFAVMGAQGKLAAADQFALARIKEFPNDTVFRRFVAESAISRREFSAAAAHYRAMLALLPNDPAILNNLASLARELKQPDALDLAERAYKLVPNNPAIMDTLASVLVDKGDVGRALTLLEKASTKSPPDSPIRLHYAVVLNKAGKRAEARRELEALAALGARFKGQAEVQRLLRE